MSALTSFKRRLKPNKVYLAEKTAEKKIEFAKQIVLERASRDAEFAADVLKAVGADLPKEFKDVCQKSISDSQSKALVEKWNKCEFVTKEDVIRNPNLGIILESEESPVEDVSLGDGFVATQSDGGGTIIVHETEIPGYPRDGQ